jgi:hypothetical protein
LKGVPTVAVKTPDDLAAAHELLDAAHDADMRDADTGVTP